MFLVSHDHSDTSVVCHKSRVRHTVALIVTFLCLFLYSLRDGRTDSPRYAVCLCAACTTRTQPQSKIPEPLRTSLTVDKQETDSNSVMVDKGRFMLDYRGLYCLLRIQNVANVKHVL